MNKAERRVEILKTAFEAGYAADHGILVGEALERYWNEHHSDLPFSKIEPNVAVAFQDGYEARTAEMPIDDAFEGMMWEKFRNFALANHVMRGQPDQPFPDVSAKIDDLAGLCPRSSEEPSDDYEFRCLLQKWKACSIYSKEITAADYYKSQKSELAKRLRQLLAAHPDYQMRWKAQLIGLVIDPNQI